ncbi:3D-(3,5/4)-trihydroxycyclohexane-1,2-dione acylhydrolase (decyclizing) [Caulobacter vibrioides]|uniref:IolD protein n=2 Tax=Caulobacter vibrioides TaxID=155892 RepID=Q9A8Q4_CAUVC|nr:3D-(3,5/4)-trihydroxycyclohexane-1,2-dione acylhydrolase (decyclizing) [Caulobacter vibrioides]YP_002516730.1 myo-inositol catabolism protein IolD [Caulobacter vibrioides NA1000]AAK23280.1 iolD protein [Caulobacter vibrioides CB15]ACL94822.1 myo-inositol catabolism protein IolD [Caulobacter vibrioides NA1000]ATC28113.1 3D-(3,5/4)-trihydroxycyclohexane-1,2-dione acylhydrolase (decyclizing) [Caulobacter vibrioides]QXZ53377.1 3D-(3,5/4)-trihydroxycyclohexane-1,2-dione acylhydrolase (decyclizin
MALVRLTAAQATVRWLAAQHVETSDGEVPYFAGVWAIFGHGNVAGLGEALHGVRDVLLTYRAHNEQGMAHAAIAFAKQSRRERAMVCTTSIGPGATNMVTAAALAHVNRLPVLFLPGDVYASRRPDPVLQQIEDFGDGTISANECFKPVSRYFDRITRPEQILDALPRALAVMLDPATCGPATLAFCQDVQAEAFDYPQAFFAKRVWRIRAPQPDPRELDDLVGLIKAAERPLIVAGGGVLYARAEAALADLANDAGLPVVETQGGKGSLAWDHPLNLGAVGVTGTTASVAAAEAADLVIGLGTRLQDFTTGSRALFGAEGRKLVQVNVAPHDAHKHGATSVVGDALAVLEALAERLDGWRAPVAWTDQATSGVPAWNAIFDASTRADTRPLPTDAQVLGAVWRASSDDSVVVCAAGGLPGELHKLWRTRMPGGYHVEYGFSCMGYEIAGAVGVKMAEPDREVHVMVGDGSYLMLNSELATSVMLGTKLIVTVLDNRGYGCINRLQAATGGAAFNNLLADTLHETLPDIDFAAHAASLGARSEKVGDLSSLEAALQRAKASDRTYVVVIDTDPMPTTEGGAWWDVAVPEVSVRPSVNAARADYDLKIKQQRTGD